MGRVVDGLFKAAEAVLAALLLAMVLMVFGNVVLRYAFNGGITVSEELSRFCFVWLVFIGAVVAMREGAHLGMDTLVARLAPRGQRLCRIANELLVIACCAMFFWGTVRQHEVNATNSAPVTGLSMIWVFGIAYVTSLGIGLLAAHQLWRVISGRMPDAELVAIRETEETLPAAPRPAQELRA
ncbi:TRAP transporter small permease [Pseudaquabacterium rugosum]|uniref:TRAP transporter small permease protein n=1 Tax=Pseudaquabacterium rugosum TaxID=2984194 RepID=A0ABU9B5V6_9BURK